MLSFFLLKNHRKSVISSLNHNLPFIELNPLEILYYPATKKIKTEEELASFAENNPFYIGGVIKYPFYERTGMINWYFKKHTGYIIKTIAEQGYFVQDIPLQLRDTNGTPKKVYYCFCGECLSYFVRFSRKADTCLLCRLNGRRHKRREKLVEDQRICRTIKKGITPRYCKHCGKLLPNQNSKIVRNGKKEYCDMSCQQSAYYYRKKTR